MTLIITALITTSASMAAITAMTGVSLFPITLADAYYGTTPESLNVSTNPGLIYLSFKVTCEGENFILESTTITSRLNGVEQSVENYNTFAPISTLSRVGVSATGTYTVGPMGQGEILVGCGTRDETAPFIVSMMPGDVWEGECVFKTNQGNITSTGTVAFIPEPSSAILGLLGASICCLRRRRH